MTDSPTENIAVSPKGDDLLNWTAIITGPTDSSYKGGKFHLTLTFLADYPFKPPKVQFVTKIYHPNVDPEGNICMEMLKTDHWKPAHKIIDVLMSLYSLLVEPNADDPLSVEIAEVYKTDIKKFDKTAKEWTKKHAS